MVIKGSNEVYSIVRDALDITLKKVFNKNNIIKDAKLRSSIFVSVLGKELSKSYEDHKLKVVGFDVERKRRTSGEWLLDIVIVKEKAICDAKKKQSKAEIPYQIIWAVESESSTNLHAFAEDFGKLLCVRSENYLFLNGLNQKKEENRNSFVERRLETVKKLLNEIENNYNNLYFAFWPTPAKNNNGSLWDDFSSAPSELLNMVRVKEL